MNQFFYEQRGKEKIKDLLREGQQSQAFYRSGTPQLNSLNKLPKLILILSGILGILGLLGR
jgi:hypothetical protein